jgi:hypothetical protein
MVKSYTLNHKASICQLSSQVYPPMVAPCMYGCGFGLAATLGITTIISILLSVAADSVYFMHMDGGVLGGLSDFLKIRLKSPLFPPKVQDTFGKVYHING